MNHQIDCHRPSRKIEAALAGILFALAGIVPARAADLASAWGTTQRGKVRLIAVPGADGAVRLGLDFQLADGWKIYWRAPGDAGLPPEIDWTGSTNLKLGAISWPVPERFVFAGLQTFGYEGEVVLPVAVERVTKGDVLNLKASVDFLTCGSLCVPNRVDLALTIPPDAVGPGPYAALLDRFTADVPTLGAVSGIAIDKIIATASGKDGVLLVTLSAKPPLDRPDILVEGAGDLAFLAPEKTDGALRLVAPGEAKAVAALAGKTLTLTVIDRASHARAATIEATAISGDAR